MQLSVITAVTCLQVSHDFTYLSACELLALIGERHRCPNEFETDDFTFVPLWRRDRRPQSHDDPIPSRELGLLFCVLVILQVTAISFQQHGVDINARITVVNNEFCFSAIRDAACQ